MPSSLALPPQRVHPERRVLILITLLVLMAHAMLLGGMPDALRLFAARPDDATPPEALRFVTRTLTPPPVAVPTPRPQPRRIAKVVKPTPAVAATTPPPEAPVAVSPEQPLSTEASGAPMAASPEGTVPAASPPNGGTAEATTEAKAPETQASAPVVATSNDAQRISKLQPPAPVRLLFDGRGEERGFVKYAASAELLWLPVGAEYSARLEISAWGFRLRTWTSRGQLGDEGLMPTRFGDKPRGAEQATHFQRDKGIISFSANNPDVPLQAGAQDKLSALLQLSAMVAGEPTRYSSGTQVSFQAADAHRAEPWTFTVGALEPLELPGGTLDGLKLDKQPTVEFDQRIEVWLAPSNHYLPVRLRITEANGAFADLLWRNTQKPD